MRHARVPLWIAAVCGPDLRLKAAVVVCAFFGGCGTYLHDDALQKKTDSVVTVYKAADVKDAVASAIAAQSALDAVTVQNVITRENAARDALLAPLMLQQPSGGTPLKTLQAYIEGRVFSLTGSRNVVGKVDILEQFRLLEQNTANLSTQQMFLAKAGSDYKEAGGQDFTSCPFTPPTGQTAVAMKLGASVHGWCHTVQVTSDAIKQNNTLLQVEGAGEISAAQKGAEMLDTLASSAAAKEASQTEVLKAKKDAVIAAAAAAASRVPAATDAGAASDAAAPITVQQALEDLAKALDTGDQVAGAFGVRSPGTALANVKFRKTNLCDVVAAEAGTSCAGGKPDPAASEVTAAIGNISAGLAALSAPPDSGVTSVALAYQDAIGNVAQTQVSLIKQQAALRRDEQNRLLLELGYLQLAYVRLADAQNSMPSKVCLEAGFGRAIADASAGCSPQYKQSIAEALVAVNQAFSIGLTIARVDLVKTANLTFDQKLQVTQQVANARSSVIEIVVNEIGAYGQGGVQPSTIAAFLQAFGIIGIAAK